MTAPARAGAAGIELYLGLVTSVHPDNLQTATNGDALLAYQVFAVRPDRNAP